MGACPLTGPVWGDGNILLGGLGSDRLEGRGANDVLDGDRYLQVRISVRTNPDDPATEIGSTDLMEHTYQAGNPHTLEADVAAGVIDPGNLVAVREVITPTAAQTAGNIDTAVFSGPQANYTVTTTGGDGTLGSAGSTTTVTDNVGADGTDTLRNIEQLAFSDTVVTNAPAIGAATAGNARATVTWTAPTVGVASSFNIKTLDVTTNPAGVQVGGLLTAPARDTSLVVPGLTNGNKYVFQVSANERPGHQPVLGSIQRGGSGANGRTRPSRRARGSNRGHCNGGRWNGYPDLDHPGLRRWVAHHRVPGAGLRRSCCGSHAAGHR